MTDVTTIVAEYCAESRVDYIGLWQIASRVQNDIGSRDDGEVKKLSIDVVKGLIACGVEPGDYDYGGEFRHWSGTTLESVKRIEQEWDDMKGRPSLVEPICWFALRKQLV